MARKMGKRLTHDVAEKNRASTRIPGEVTTAQRGGKTSQRNKDLGFAWVHDRLLRAEVVGGTVTRNGEQHWRATGSRLFYSACSVPDLACESINLRHWVKRRVLRPGIP